MPTQENKAMLELAERLGDVLDIIVAAQMQFARSDEHSAYYLDRWNAVDEARKLIRTQSGASHDG